MDTTAQQIYARELRAVRERLTPNCPGGRYSGQQIAYARGVARRRTLEALEALEAEREAQERD